MRSDFSLADRGSAVFERTIDSAKPLIILLESLDGKNVTFG